jgi:SAM-dependent methyltransferase
MVPENVCPKQIAAGEAVYTKRMLGIYDVLVLGVSNRLIWRCPTPRLLAHYDTHVRANHLDVGVGTGYFLDRCRFPSRTPRVALMDLNRNALDFAARRIARYKPETYVRNVLEPISLDAMKFDSIGINYLLHCLPGSIDSKSVAFDHLKALMKPGAVIFGATLLQGGVAKSWPAKRLMDFYNGKAIFSNEKDSLDGLRRTFEERFRSVSIDIVGCAAVFSGRA